MAYKLGLPTIPIAQSCVDKDFPRTYRGWGMSALFCFFFFFLLALVFRRLPPDSQFPLSRAGKTARRLVVDPTSALGNLGRDFAEKGTHPGWEACGARVLM